MVDHLTGSPGKHAPSLTARVAVQARLLARVQELVAGMEGKVTIILTGAGRRHASSEALVCSQSCKTLTAPAWGSHAPTCGSHAPW